MFHFEPPLRYVLLSNKIHILQNVIQIELIRHICHVGFLGVFDLFDLETRNYNSRNKKLSARLIYNYLQALKIYVFKCPNFQISLIYFYVHLFRNFPLFCLKFELIFYKWHNGQILLQDGRTGSFILYVTSCI